LASSAAREVYADLFDDDLDAVATALNDGANAAGVGKVWVSAPLSETQATRK
jgi:hypothetical protein